MLPQLLFGPVPYEPPGRLPEYTPEGAGAGFRELIQNVTNSAQVTVNKQNNTSEALQDNLENAHIADVPAIAPGSSPVQQQLPLSDPGQGVDESGAAVANTLRPQHLNPLGPAISVPAGGNLLPDPEAVTANSDRAELPEEIYRHVVTVRHADALSPGGRANTTVGPPDLLPDSGAVATTSAAATVTPTALTAQTRAGNSISQGQAVATSEGQAAAASLDQNIAASLNQNAAAVLGVGHADSALAEASISSARVSQVSPASRESAALTLPGDRAQTVSAPRPEQQPVLPNSTVSQVPVAEVSATVIDKPAGVAHALSRQAIDPDDRSTASQRATDAVQSAAQAQSSTNTTRQNALDPLAAGSALMAAAATVTDQRLVGRSSLATRMENLSTTAGAVAADAVAKPQTTPVDGNLQMLPDSVPKATAATESALQRIQSSITSAQRAGAAADRFSERRQSDIATLATSASAETTRPESAGLRAEASVQSAQIPAQLARQILHSHTQNLSELRMQLKPEELGQLDLKLRVEGERVHVAIVTQQPGVRELLEAQLPQLRSLLQEGGFQLGDVDVRQQGGKSGDQSAAETPERLGAVADQADEANVPSRTHNPGNSSGIIDAFA